MEKLSTNFQVYLLSDLLFRPQSLHSIMLHVMPAWWCVPIQKPYLIFLYHRHEHVLNVRQSSCSNNIDCLAENVTSIVPSRYVECDGGVCVCTECFERDDNGTCSIVSPGCYYFENSECVDNRRSQLVAFLLSLFLGEVGAANFYIGQNGLGAGQLVLFLSTFIIICCGACLPICCVCCIIGGDGEGSTAVGPRIEN